MPIDPRTLDTHGLTPDEYRRIVDVLGREPNRTELGLFSVMWSEHCSYKSSRLHLGTLPSDGPRVLQGPGENAGAVDIGDGLAAVFKIESHNHPSFIEPYQGAATGVGGIIRDIFTMGARPIALLNSLRFGSLDEPRTRYLLEGVVAGIGGYGNAIGIPTVGGEIAFEPSYAGNPLVNAFCLGIVKADELVRGTASGVGNPVYYVGAKTGRDGIHGATMASAEFDDRSAEKRPAVQVGDPFMEKLLLEACLELTRTDALVGLQDMGAAGLTCATCEMGARGGTGIEIDVSLVPQRETGMTPYEIMLSESQERMLLVATRGREAQVQRVFEKWDLHAVAIGRVTDDGLLRVKDGDVVVAEVPNRPLADEAPLYDRPTARPADLDARQRLDPSSLRPPPPPEETLLTLLSSPAIASKRWVYRQYDSMVRTNTLVAAGLGAPVVRIKGTQRALAMSVDGNGRYGFLDPRRGARLAVAEAARNVACAGALPIGATNCLNFGSPERPDIMWQFVESVEGIAEACRALAIPITGGNVSFYNETDGHAIYPTPVIGVVGLLEHADRALTRAFREPGAAIVLLGVPRPSLGGSEYLKVAHDLVAGVPPEIDLPREAALIRLLADASAAGLLQSAHDCSDGGLGVTLAECCFDTGGVGAQVEIPGEVAGPHDPTTLLFGETAGCAVVSLAPAHVDALRDRAQREGVPAHVIGATEPGCFRVDVTGARVIDLDLARMEARWGTALERRLRREVA
jgi:phosphoribosylformylglycinamidine synthase